MPGELGRVDRPVDQEILYRFRRIKMFTIASANWFLAICSVVSMSTWAVRGERAVSHGWPIKGHGGIGANGNPDEAIMRDLSGIWRFYVSAEREGCLSRGIDKNEVCLYETLSSRNEWAQERLVVTIPEGDAAEDISFSQDGARVAYRRTLSNSQCIVVDGAAGEVFPGNLSAPVFNASATVVAYRAEVGGKCCIVTNKKKGEEYDMSSWPLFSPDGKTLAYYARNGAKAYLIVDDKVLEYDGVGVPTWSRDGTLFAYPAKQGDSWFIVINGKKGWDFDKIDLFPHFVGKGNLITYVAEKGDKHYLVIGDEKRELEADNTSCHTIGSDGKWLAHVERKGEKMILVTEGGKEDEWDLINQVVIAPDEKAIAYKAMNKVHGAETWHVISSGGRSEEYRRVSDLRFSPDGRLVYTARKEGNAFVVTDATRGNPFDEVGPLAFSADGKSIAYAARKGNDWIVVVNGRENGSYDQVWLPKFDDTGKKLAFGARVGRELWWKVLEVR